VSAAVSLSDAKPLRTVGDDGCVHFSHLKRLALSGAHYLHAVNVQTAPTRAMLVSTAVHQILLGPRADKKVVVYSGDARRGNDWKAFAAEHAEDEILTAPEWADAAEAANEIAKDPLVIEALADARTEVPLKWEDNGIRCSTSGVDIVGRGMLGDLKGTHTALPDLWKRSAFRMLYHCQMVWYRRGAIANGIDVSKGLFVLGYEMSPPYAVVPLEMTEELIVLGEQTVSLWLERLRNYQLSCPLPMTPKDWPAYTQSAMPWERPAWMSDDEDDDEG
jgi:hypothetical protein